VGKFLTAIICIALVALCIYGMWHGWRSRLARQANITTIFGNWLDRVGFDSLGFKSKSTLLIYPDSIIFTRNGAKDLWIPAKKLAVITTDRGMAGKVVEKNGLVVIGWTLDVPHPLRRGQAGGTAGAAPHRPERGGCAREVDGRTGSLNPGVISLRTHTHRFCLRSGEHPPKAP